jgi:hypothetical protein
MYRYILYVISTVYITGMIFFQLFNWFQLFSSEIKILKVAKMTFLKGVQECGIAMSDSYIEPAGQVDFPG